MKTNLRLKNDVIDSLQQHARAYLDEIAVKTSDDIVILLGIVRTQGEKWSIVHAAERVAGVKAIVNEIKVQSRKDEEIARAVLDQLRAKPIERDGSGFDDTIKIHVENGWVIVRGTVASEHLRTKIEAIVRNVSGLRGLSNRIRTKARTATSESEVSTGAVPRRPARTAAPRSHNPMAKADALLVRA